MKIKHALIVILFGLVAAEVGYYFYTNRGAPAAATSTSAPQSPAATTSPPAPSSTKVALTKRTAVIAVATTDGGIREGLELSAKGINETKRFGIRIDLAYGARPNAVATIELDKKLDIIIGDRTISIDSGKPSTIFISKVRAQYGHDPLPWSVEAFDSLRVIAIALAQIPEDQPLNSSNLQETIARIKSYTGESGAVEFNKDGTTHRK